MSEKLPEATRSEKLFPVRQRYRFLARLSAAGLVLILGTDSLSLVSQATFRSEVGEDGSRFVTREDDRHTLRRLGPLDVFDQPDFLTQDLLVEKQQGAEGLVLRRSADLAFHRQVRQKTPDMEGAQFLRVAFAVEQDVALDPIHVSLLGADTVVLEAANVAHLIQKLRLAGDSSGRYRAVHEAVACQTRRPDASRIRRRTVAFVDDVRSPNLSWVIPHGSVA